LKSTAKKLKAMESSGNSSEPPFHRMREKSIAENAVKAFEKVDVLIDGLRSDKERFRKRKEKAFRK